MVEISSEHFTDDYTPNSPTKSESSSKQGDKSPFRSNSPYKLQKPNYFKKILHHNLEEYLRRTDTIVIYPEPVEQTKIGKSNS